VITGDNNEYNAKTDLDDDKVIIVDSVEGKRLLINAVVDPKQ
jgi:hypothetical protein